MIKKTFAGDLRLADTIKLFDGPWGYAVITQIKDGEAHWFRPYAVTADFSYSGGVIPYTGFETGSLSFSSKAPVELWERKELK